MPGFAQFNLLIALERDVDCSWDQQLHTMLGSHYPTKLLLIDDGPDVPQFLRIIEGSSDLACTATADTVQASKLALRDQPHIILWIQPCRRATDCPSSRSYEARGTRGTFPSSSQRHDRRQS